MTTAVRKITAEGMFWTYKLVSGFWRGLILNFWGIISECQHQPTCSEYMRKEIKESGWKGFGRGIKKIWNCR